MYWWVNDDADNDFGSANNWASSEGGAGGYGVPSTGDTIAFSDTSSPDDCNMTVNSGNVTVAAVYMASADTGGTDDWSGTFSTGIYDITTTTEFKDSTSSTCTGSSGGYYICEGDLTFQGTYTANYTIIQMSGTGAMALDVGSNIIHGLWLKNATNNVGTVTLNSNLNGNGIGGISLYDNGTLDFNGYTTSNLTTLNFVEAGCYAYLGEGTIGVQDIYDPNGDIDAETSTVKIDNGAVATIYTTSTLYNLTVDNTGNIARINTNDLAISNDFTLTNGTFDGDTLNFTVGGAVSMTNGVWQMGSGDTEVKGNFTVSGGTLTQETSTLKLTNTSAAQTINIGAQTLNNLEVNKGAYDLTITGTLKVSNNFSFSGTSSSAQIKGGTIEVGVNVTWSGTFGNGTTNLTVNGSGAQNITTNNLSSPFANTTVNKSGGTASLVGSLTMPVAGSDLVVQAGTLDCVTYALTVPDAVTISGGTLLGGTQTLDIGGIFTMSSGAFTGTSGEWQQGGAITFTGGTFTHNNGTLVVDETFATRTLTFNSQTFYKIEIDSGGSVITIADTVKVTNELRFTDASSVRGASGTWELEGTANHVSTSNLGTANDCLIKFTGGGAQSCNAGGGSSRTCKIEMAKSGGTLTLADTMKWNCWTNTSGTLDAGASSIEFPGSCTITDDGSAIFNDVSFTYSAGTYTIVGTFTVGGEMTLDTVGALSTGTLRCLAGLTINDSAITGTGANPNIEMAGVAGDQLITLSASTNIDDIDLNVKNTSGKVKIAGGTGNEFRTDYITVDPGAILCSNGNDITIDTTLTNNGIVRELVGDTITAGSVVGNAISENAPDCDTDAVGIVPVADNSYRQRRD